MPFAPSTRDFIDRMRTELAGLSKSLEPREYRDLVCYFHGFFSEEDRRTDPEARKCRECDEPLDDDESSLCGDCEAEAHEDAMKSAGLR